MPGSPAGCTRRPVNRSHPEGYPGSGAALSLLTYNIQTGIATSRYRDYLTQSWKHVLPYRARRDNLDRIAGLISRFDLVGLQETDAGSLRSHFTSQVGYLADKAGFPFWYQQVNRRLGKIAQTGIGLLSRVRLNEVAAHRLPGAIPGRGALIATFGEGDRRVTLIIFHLALGKRARLRQIDYISDLVGGSAHVILMGDMNCRPESREMKVLLAKTGLREPAPGMHTFPSWRPIKNIDHILVSPSLEVEGTRVLNFPFSDHLPIAARVIIPRRFPSSRASAGQRLAASAG